MRESDPQLSASANRVPRLPTLQHAQRAEHPRHLPPLRDDGVRFTRLLQQLPPDHARFPMRLMHGNDPRPLMRMSTTSIHGHQVLEGPDVRAAAITRALDTPTSPDRTWCRGPLQICSER
jgi:hypothetical protein